MKPGTMSEKALEANSGAVLDSEADKLAKIDALRNRPYRPTAEITVLCLTFCNAITGTVMHDLLINRTCLHHLGRSAEECARLQETGDRPQDVQDLESEVQQFTTIVNMIKGIIDGLVPAALAMFVGVWSNRHGRKPLIVWPALGFAISMVVGTVYSFVEGLGPWWYVGTSLPYAFLGGGSAFYTGAFCLLNDLSTEKNRTLRLVLLQSSVFTGTILGSLSATYTYSALGMSNLLITASCISIGGFLYAVFFIPESVADPEKGGVLTIFDFSLVKDMVRTCFIKRPDYGRAVLFLLAISYFIDLFVSYGTGNIDYLYVRQKLGWALHDQSIFNAVNQVIMVAGLFLGVVILQKILKLSDGVATLISYVCCLSEALIRAFAIATWMMYLGSVVSIFRGLSFPVIRSMLTKRVVSDDVAKVFALMATVDAVLPIVAPLLYNMLYRQTLTTVPGAVYFMNAGFFVICLVIMSVVHFLMLRYSDKRKTKL